MSIRPTNRSNYRDRRRHREMALHDLQPLQPNRPTHGPWWYVHGWHNGRAYTRGPYNSEGEARAAGTSMFKLGDTWAVEELPTRDIGRAKAILRDHNLTGGKTLDVAMQPQFTKRSPT